ncbi:MAG: hypothetical protein ACKO5P_02110 [Nodosilinea sp.]
MHQQSLQAYLHLIQQLLACPNGEEWILLRQNEGLVTPDLVQVMEQVANQLAHQGSSKEAKFLHNLAGQIHHLFLAQTLPPPPQDDRAEAYLKVIKELLACPEGEEGRVLAAHPDLLGPGLVRAMQQVGDQLAVNGDREAAQYLQQWARELSRLWLQQQNFQPLTKPTAEPEPEVPPIPVVVPEADLSTATKVQAPPMPPPLADGPEDFWTEAQAVAREDTSPAPVPSEPSPSLVSGLPLAALTQHLETIATALTRLNQTLQTQTPANSNPLWYMEVLEQAFTGGWILTSEEVQQLIGVKPACTRGEDRFYRGCWVFVKAGKLGAQTAWQVQKQVEQQS